MMKDTAFTAGMALGIGIYLLVMLSLVLAGGYLLRQPLNGVKVMMSCLAAIAGQFVAMLLSPLIEASLSSVLAPGVRNIVSLLLTTTITVAILAGCLCVVAEVVQAMGWALSLFANGGALAASGLLLMFSIGILGDNTPGVVKTLAWIIIGAGLLLMLAGYQIGNSPAARREAAIPGYVPQNTIIPQPGPVFAGGSQNTIIPQPGPNYPPSGGRNVASGEGGRVTDARRETVVHDEKIRPASTAILIVSVGKDKGRRYDLPHGDIRLGRHTSTDIQIPGDEEVGREHCLIRTEGQQHVLHDLASRNFTFLNDVRVTDARVLHDNDRIRIGQTILVYKRI